MTTPTWNPVRNTVASITRAYPAVVTTGSDNGFLPGIYVRFEFFGNYGMPQLNGNVYLATILSSNTFSIDVDTTNFDSFAVGSSLQVPQVIPVGETADTLKNREQNTLNITGGA